MRYIGLVTRESEDANGKNVARIKPLCYSDGTALRPEVLTREFPQRGLAIWFNSPSNSSGRIYQFDAGEPQIKRSEDSDQRHVVTHQQLHHVLDLTQTGTVTSIGAQISTWELETELLETRDSMKVFILCKDRLVGPVEIERTVRNSLRLVEGPQLARLRTFPIPDRKDYFIQTEKGILLIDPSTPGLVPMREVDWRSDREVLKTLLKLATKRPRGGSGTSLTTAKIQQLVDEYFPEENLSEDPLTSYRVNRIKYSLESGEDLKTELSSLVDVLAEHPAVSSARSEAELAGHQKGYEVGREQGLADTFAQKAEAEAELGALLAKLEESRQALNVSQAKAEQLRKTEEAVTNRLRDHAANPERVFADAVVLRSLLQLEQVSPAPPAVRPSTFSWSEGHSVLTTESELFAICEDAGLAERLSRSLLAAISGGLVPLVLGAQGADSLERFAEVALGGRCLRVHVGPGLLEPGDLLGRLEPSMGVVIPHRSRTLDFLLQAEQDGRPAMLLLDGANRAPTESFLVPLMDVSRRRGLLSLCHPSLDQERGVAYPAEVRWPRSLILVAALTEGPTVLPLVPQALSHGVLIDVSELTLHESELPDPARPSEAALEVLRLGQLKNNRHQDSIARLKDMLPKSGSNLLPFSATAKCYGQGLLERSLPSKELKALVVADVFLPAAIALGVRLEDVLTSSVELSPAHEARLRRVAT